MRRDRYEEGDFDFAILYIDPLNVFYVMPLAVFTSYSSTISLIETDKRQRKPSSAEYRERWDLLSDGLRSRKRLTDSLPNSVKPVEGNTEPSLEIFKEGVETRWQRPVAV